MESYIPAMKSHVCSWLKASGCLSGQSLQVQLSERVGLCSISPPSSFYAYSKPLHLAYLSLAKFTFGDRVVTDH
ncbi:hypothetical protein E2C01_016120 [Portunus trituberculatus]|uniref:Uncharacterized protein n=1 Tax=Portunus trituberculatus TaxID=210409 RepID=A0A5B7DN87_PORTR|nr:hypothetical protein [Portunus trituberculatus]